MNDDTKVQIPPNSKPEPKEPTRLLLCKWYLPFVFYSKFRICYMPFLRNRKPRKIMICLFFRTAYRPAKGRWLCLLGNDSSFFSGFSDDGDTSSGMFSLLFWFLHLLLLFPFVSAYFCICALLFVLDELELRLPPLCWRTIQK